MIPTACKTLKEFNMDCWSTLEFEQWRLEHHPEHIPVPEMPTFINQENNSEDEPLLQYKPPIYISESPSADALLGDPKRSSTKLPHRNSLLVDLGSRINLIGRNTAQEFLSAAHTMGRKPRPEPKNIHCMFMELVLAQLNVRKS